MLPTTVLTCSAQARCVGLREECAGPACKSGLRQPWEAPIGDLTSTAALTPSCRRIHAPSRSDSWTAGLQRAVLVPHRGH